MSNKYFNFVILNCWEFQIRHYKIQIHPLLGFRHGSMSLEFIEGQNVVTFPSLLEFIVERITIFVVNILEIRKRLGKGDGKEGESN